MTRARALSVGMPTLLQCRDVVDSVSLCARLGLDFIELNMNLPMYQLEEINDIYLLEARDRLDIGCTLHLDENLSVCDFTPQVAEAYRETAVRAVRLARSLSMPVVTMHLHPGVYFTLPKERVYLYAQYEARYLEALRVFRGLCEEAVGGSRLRVCVENTHGFAAHERRGLELLLQSEAFGLTLDIGHLHAADDVDAPIFRQYRDRIDHMHLHDADGGACHLPLGDGVLDIAAALRLAEKRDCGVVLEVKDIAGLERSVAAMEAYT